MTAIVNDVTKRHDFVLLFECSDGNPNGDPDAGNLPRVDPETMQGLVTDVCIKRKVRDWVDLLHSGRAGYEIYVQNSGVALNAKHRRAFTELGQTKATKDDEKRNQEDARRDWMCQNFYDVRTFGAVMGTGDHRSGQVRGPLQLTFARSITPIAPLDLSITRVAITQEGTDKRTEMGRKALVTYGFYRGYGFFSPHFATKSGFSDADLALFWEALQKTWDLDHSASRGRLVLRGLYVFSHENALGNAPSHHLFERIAVRLRDGVEAPRSFEDYSVTVGDADLPAGVTLTRLVDDGSRVPAFATASQQMR